VRILTENFSPEEKILLGRLIKRKILSEVRKGIDITIQKYIDEDISKARKEDILSGFVMYYRINVLVTGKEVEKALKGKLNKERLSKNEVMRLVLEGI
jgi:hypothetical protein